MKNATKTINIYSDPGHAWAKIPLIELVALGIAGTISTYSYRKGGYAYLEEDSDLTKYYKALLAAGYQKENIKFREAGYSERRSRIRDYPFYSRRELPATNSGE